jgi:hypothetical protein
MDCGVAAIFCCERSCGEGGKLEATGYTAEEIYVQRETLVAPR